MTTDPIADIIIRIKNAHMARHASVEVPFSKIKKSISDILVEEGYLSEVTLKEGKPFNSLVLTLKYIGKSPAINDVKRLSKPGQGTLRFPLKWWALPLACTTERNLCRYSYQKTW